MISRLLRYAQGQTLAQFWSPQAKGAKPIKPIQHSGVKHSVGKVSPHSNIGRQDTPCKFGMFNTLILRTPMDQLWPQFGMTNWGNSRSTLNKQWLENNYCWTYILQLHDVDDTLTRNSYPNIPGAQEAEDNILQQTPPPRWRTILKDCVYKCIVATK